MNKNEKKNRVILAILLVLTFLVALRSIFVGFQMDEEYAMSLPWRMLKGDRLLRDIWDPHQTSAFLVKWLEWAYIKVFNTTDFMLIYLRIAGTVLSGLVSFYLYKSLKRYVNDFYGAVIALIYFNILPKSFVMPEFANMLAHFSTLLILLIMDIYYEYKDKWTAGLVIKTILSGVVMCLLVLSYPSTALVFPVVIVLAIVKRKNFPKLWGVSFTGVCVAFGGVYLLQLLSYMSFGEIFDNAKMVIASCGSHDVTDSSKLIIYLENIGVLLLITAACALVAFLVLMFIKFIGKKKVTEAIKDRQRDVTVYFCLVFLAAFVGQIIFWFFINTYFESYYDFSYYFFVVALAIFCIAKGKIADKKDSGILLWALIVNIADYVAVLALTNLTMFSSIKYLLSGIAFGLVVLVISSSGEKTKKWVKVTLVSFALATIFVKGWMYVTDDGEKTAITVVDNIARKGPLKGVLTDYMKGYMNDNTLSELDEYLVDGDNVLIWDRASVYYLAEDINVASYTTISTPSYDENSVKTYFENHEDRYPDVIMVTCWFGELGVDEDSWFYRWIEDEYEADTVTDGMYFRYFIKRRL